MVTAQPEITVDRDARHFATEHLKADLKGRSVRGATVTVTAQAIKFALQMGSTMVLARLLTPADFGLIAMVAAFTGFVSLFKDLGLSMATVQRERITHKQVSTLFWINVGLSIVLLAVSAGMAPLVAWFYGEPRLAWITVAVAGTLVFAGLTVQHQALLRRQMRFKALAIIEISSMTTGIATAITMAILDFGYWSLVGLTVGTTIANCVLVWMYSGWRPGLPVPRSGIGTMVRFGSGLTAFSILNYFTRNADNIVIGYALGSGPLGIYAKAYRLLMMPISQLNSPISSVMLPTLSRLQSSPERYRRVYLRAISTLAIVGMPLIGLLFVVADEVVLIVLGPGWEEAATIFRWLAPAALFGTINVAPGWLCTTLGRAKTQVVWAAISAPITVTAFIVGAQWGIAGVAAAFSLSWCALLLVFIAMSCNRSPVPIGNLMLSLLPISMAVIGAVAGCLLTAFYVLPHEVPLVWRVVLNTSLFAMLYCGITIAFPSSRELILSLWSDGLGSLRTKPNETTA